MREPIDDGGKPDEPEEGFGQLVVAGGEAPMSLDPAEEVFAVVAAAEAAMEGRALVASGAACGR